MAGSGTSAGGEATAVVAPIDIHGKASSQGRQWRVEKDRQGS